MWTNATRASGKNGCRIDWSGLKVKQLPQVEEAPFSRIVPAADSKLIRKTKSVSITDRNVAANLTAPMGGPRKLRLSSESTPILEYHYSE